MIWLADFQKYNPLYDEPNKKVTGKMKDKCAGTPIAKYIGLYPFESWGTKKKE